jgi:hypothetical protein
LSRCRRIADKGRCHHPSKEADTRGIQLTYKMIAERGAETVRIERESLLIIAAKARIWISEGWQVVVTDASGKSYAADEFDRLLAA